MKLRWTGKEKCGDKALEVVVETRIVVAKVVVNAAQF